MWKQVGDTYTCKLPSAITDSATITVSYSCTVTEADVTAGKIVNNASVKLLNGNVPSEPGESTATVLTYTVNHLEQGTDEEVADPKTATVTFTGDQTTVSEAVADVSGYSVVGVSSRDFTVTADGPNVFTFYYTQDPVRYTVNYYFETAVGVYPKDPNKTVPGNDAVGTVIPYTTVISKIPEFTAPTGNYVLDYVENKDGVVTKDSVKNVVNVYFALDTNENTTPDIYEATIHYQVEGGTWTAVTEDATEEDHAVAIAPKTVIVTLKKWSDETKVWEDRTEAEINADRAVPTGMLPLEGYTSSGAGWHYVDGGDVRTEVTDPANQSLTAGETYTFRYIFQPQANYAVNYYLVDANGVQAEVTPNTSVVTVPANMELHRGGLLPHGSTVTLGKTDGDGVTQIPAELTVGGHHYVLRDADYTLTVSNAMNVENVINVYYDVDEIGEKDPGEPDGVPDKYQAEVTFNVVHGKWSDNSTSMTKVVTLMKDGEQSEEGSYVLTAEDIPASTADTGYQAGSWDTAPEGQTITKDGAVYTYTYVAQARTITINYVDDSETPVELKDANVIDTTYGADYDVDNVTNIPASIDKDGHHYIKENVDGTVSGTVDNNVEITVIYRLSHLPAAERPSLMARPRWCPTPARPSRIRMCLWRLLV